MSLILPGFTCPKCQHFTGFGKSLRTDCRACGYREPPHCAVCRSEDIVALCDEHGPRCAEHAETHVYCEKLTMIRAA
jgi:hypothetical protein